MLTGQEYVSWPLQTVLRITGHQDDVNAVAFLDGSSHLIASGSDDTLIKVGISAFPLLHSLLLQLHVIYIQLSLSLS